MSQKQDKKLRKYFRQRYQGMAEILAKEHMQIIKPKPKYFPMWLWVKLLGIFIKIK